MNHDIAHCNGIMMSDESVCNQCASCRRYQAHVESVKLQLEYVCYIEVPKDATPINCPEIECLEEIARLTQEQSDIKGRIAAAKKRLDTIRSGRLNPQPSLFE